MMLRGMCTVAKSEQKPESELEGSFFAAARHSKTVGSLTSVRHPAQVKSRGEDSLPSVGPHALFPLFFCCHSVKLRREFSIASFLPKVFSEKAYSSNDAGKKTLHEFEVLRAAPFRARLERMKRAFIKTYQILLFLFTRKLEESPWPSPSDKRLYQLFHTVYLH